MDPESQLEPALRHALEKFPEVVFAVLFGSAVSDRLRQDSDIDVGVYGGSGSRLEVEEPRELEREAEIQVALERASGRNVDLLVLNRAPATVCAAALLEGRVFLLRDRPLYTRYFLAVTSTAIDFLETEREFRAIRERSRSMSELDRSRLERILEFIEEELQDRSQFQAVSLGAYRGDRALRRNLDRWVETLINAAIDIGKIVLAAENRRVPQTYGQILAELESVLPFAVLEGHLEQLAPLRNLLAHEYLDLRFGRLKRFVEEDSQAVADLAKYTRRWLGEDA